MDHTVMVFENADPTDTEIKMFHYAGFYKLIDTEEYSQYAVVYIDVKNEFPNELRIDECNIDWDSFVMFYHMSETVKIKGMFDAAMINMIAERINELGWK